jgi:hypothetical protein
MSQANALWDRRALRRTWRHGNPRPSFKKKRNTPAWPELRCGDKLTLQPGQMEAGDWGKDEPRPPMGNIQPKSPAPTKEAKSDVRPILDELEVMRTEQDEPDFIHSVKDHAYEIARPVIESAYTHYLGSTPTPAIAPDGDGGLIVEWRSGECEVRLIAAHSKEHKSYIYSKGRKTAKIDYELSGFVLAKALRDTFTQ